MAISARWRQVKHGQWCLIAARRDGGATLATVEHKAMFHFAWSLPNGRYGVAGTLYAAQRQARRALRIAGNAQAKERT